MSQPTYTPPGGEPAVTITEAFGLGWWAFKSNYGMLLLAVVVFIAISFGVGVVQVVVENALSIEGLLSIPLTLLVSAQLQAGFTYIGVRAARGERPDLDLLFRGFSTSRRYWSLAGAEGITILIAIACLVPALFVLFVVGVGGGALGVAVVVIAMVVAMIYLLVRVGFAGPLIVDEHGPAPGPIEAISLSWRATRGPTGWALFVLALLLALIALATALALVLPLVLFGIPLILGVWGAAYALVVAPLGIGPGGPHCRHCGYDLTGVPGPTCPECGAPRHPKDPVE